MSKAEKWLIDVNECDVTRDALPSLVEYRQKRDEWQHWISGDPYHAIDNQITSLFWNDAIYRLIYELRRHTIQSEKLDFACRNNHLSWMIDIGFMQFQFLTIRRVMEPGKSNRERQVITLRRLFDDVSNFGSKLTREIFVSFDGTPYDHQSFDTFLAGIPESIRRSRSPVARPTSDAWSEERHRVFDEYSKKTPETRGRGDTICPDVFDRLRNVLKSAPFEKIKTHFEKTVAHAADEFSRANAPLDGIPFSEIWECHKVIFRVRNEIACMLSLPHMAVVPHMPADVFDYLDKPFVMASCIDDVISEWTAENDKREAWANLPDSATESDGVIG